jgi:hypothetical protein
MSQFHEFQPNEPHDDAPQTDPVGGNPPQIPPVASSRQEPRQERLRHVLYGSLEAIDTTIKNLHARNYADPGDWCDPIPVPLNRTDAAQQSGTKAGWLSGVEATDPPRQWMVIMTKILLID